ncbi:hypothetical protein D9M71_812270 [compost metagenome]
MRVARATAKRSQASSITGQNQHKANQLPPPHSANDLRGSLGQPMYSWVKSYSRQPNTTTTVTTSR